MDCKHLSPFELVWRIFGFDRNFKQPSVERSSYDLSQEQTVIFYDNEPIDSVMQSTSHAKSMFLAWFEVNEKYADAKKLTYP